MSCSTALADGYQFGATYTGDIWSNVSGGVRKGTRYLDNLDLTLEIDTEAAWGFGNGTVFAYGMYNNHSIFSDELVGDLQVISNIEATRAWRIFELWYEYSPGPWSVRIGLYDLNSEFDVAESRGLFLNSSHGVGPELSQTGQNGPSIFPVSSLSIRAAVQQERYTLRMAVLDGVPGDPEDPASNEVDLGSDDGILAIAEVEFLAGSLTRVWAGYWGYSADFEQPFGAGIRDDNRGWYLGAERDFQLGSKAAHWFVRHGQANEHLNTLRDFSAAGVLINGLFSARPDDQLGLAIGVGGAGRPYRNSLRQEGLGDKASETNWELTYRAVINPHLVLQPDIQYVQNPSASDQYKNAWVVGLRFELSY